MIYLKELDVPHDHLITFEGVTYRGHLAPGLPLYPNRDPRLGIRLEPTPAPFPPPREPYLPRSRKQEADWEISDGRVYLIGVRGDYELLGDAPLFADWHTGNIMLIKLPTEVVDRGVEVITLKVEAGVVVSMRTSRRSVRQAPLDR